MVMWEVVAPMAAAIVLFLTIGGVLVLRPIAQHLGGYLEALTQRQLEPGKDQELEHMREMLETINPWMRQDDHDRFFGALERAGVFAD